MRRVSVKHAKPGMELAKPLFDQYGHPLFPTCTVLTEKHLAFLKAKGAGELLVEDNRVGDVIIEPLIKPNMQQEATAATQKMIRLGTNGEALTDPDIYAARLEIERLSHAMVKAILSSPLGEPDLSGSMLLEDYLYVHPVKTAILAILLAREAGYDNNSILAVGRAAMLQNFGYIWLNPELRKSEGSRSGKDRKQFEEHPVYGAKALGIDGRIPPEVIEAILQHHERWDGTGYPNGTRGWDISPFAQLISMADTFYDLVSARPGREPYKPMDACEYIMAFAGELFDPELVQVFARRVPMYPSGVMAKLSSGEIGIVVDANLGHIGRPTLRIVTDTKGNDIDPPYDMNLSQSDYQYKLITELPEI